MQKTNDPFSERYIHIGLRVAHYRKLRGMTQDQLAEKAGISPGYLSQVETPSFVQPVSLKTLYTLADILGVHPTKLQDFDE